MKKKKSFKVLVLSILTIMCTVLAVPSFASADAADGEAAADYFPTVNHDSYDFPIVLNVDAKGVGTGNTGFMTMDIDQEKVSAVSIVLPIIICLTASAVAYIVLRQIKTFKQKNSDSLELLTESTSRFISMIKNPSLLLAICFGLGCAAPVFFLQANISKADAHEITDIDYDSTDFSTYNGRNPYGIKIDVGYNNLLNSSRTDEEMIADAAEEEAGIEPKFERIIEEDGEFVVGSVDATFTTFNYNGFFADYSMKSGVVCAEETDAGIQECREKTNLVNGDNKIPSITEKMTKAEFEKLKTAAWGWSDDGKDYYPLFWPSVREDPIMDEKNQTIYFAVKLTNSVAPGAYQSADNFQIYAENNKLTNNMFGYYNISYRNGGDSFGLANPINPLFLKDKPGKIAVTSEVPSANGECKEFIGWSETTQVDYVNAEDETTIKLYHAGDKITVTKEMVEQAEREASGDHTRPLPVITLNAIWKNTNTGCNEYNVQIDQSFKMIGVVGREIKEGEDVVDIIPEYATENGEYKYTKYCPESKPDCLSTFIDISGHEKNISSLYSTLAVSVQKRTTNETETFDLLSKIGVPELKGYKFLGWELWESTETGLRMTKDYVYKNGEFYVKNGETESKENKITINKAGDKTSVFLSAKWELNSPIIKVKFIDPSEPGLGTWSSDDSEEQKKLRHDGVNIEKWVENNSGMDKISGVPIIYDFVEFKDPIGKICMSDETEAEDCVWNPDGTRKSIDVSDLENADLDGENRAIFESQVYLVPNSSEDE